MIWSPKSLSYRNDQFEPIGSGTTSYQTGPIFSNKNLKFILNQLRHFKGQLFGSLIMKYGISRSMLSFIKNDLIYHT